MSENLNPKEVVLLSAHKEALDSIAGDIKALQEHVENEITATGVKMNENADLLAKTVDDLRDIDKRLSDVQSEVSEFRQAVNVVGGSNELANECKAFGPGFSVPQGGEDAYRAFAEGSKPTVKHLVEGAMLDDGSFFVSKHEDIKRIQSLMDDALVIDALKRFSGNTESYKRAGGIASLPQVKEARRIAEQVQKAATDMVDTSDLSNWVPTHFSPQLYEVVRAGLPEINVFNEVTMPGKTLDLNTDLTEWEAQYVAEVTSNASANPFSDATMQALTDGKATLTAKKLRARIVFSGEVEEDAIVPQLALYRRGVVRAFQEGLADAVINGDEGGDLDNTASSRTHFGKACPATGNDARKIADGLRALAADSTSTVVDLDNADLNATTVASMLAALGEWAHDPSRLVLFTSFVGHANMLADSDFKTRDVMGDRATLLTGQIGSIFNVPVFLSRRYPVNLGADGKVAATDDTSLRTGAVLAHRDAMVIGNRRRLTLETERYVATDTNEIVAFWRGDIVNLYPTSKTWIASAIDVAL